MLLIFISVLVILVAFLVITQRKLVNLDEKCYNALMQIDVQVHHRQELLKTYIALAKIDLSLEEVPSLQEDVHSLAIAKKNYLEVKEKTASIDVNGNPLLKQTLDELHKATQAIRYSEMVYNDMVTKFNRLTRSMPTSFVATWLGFGEYKDYLEFEE